jgi:hypothetical protein
MYIIIKLIAVDSVSSLGCIGVRMVPTVLQSCVTSTVRYRILRPILFFSFLSVRGSVADPDPGSGIQDPVPFDPWIGDPGSGIGFFRIPDPKPILLRA